MDPQPGAPPFYTTQAPPSQVYRSSSSSSSSSSSEQLLNLILRGVAVVLTFIAAIVMGAAKETVVGQGQDYEVVSVKIKSTYSAAFVYFVIINVLVFLWSLGSLALSLLRSRGLKLLVAMGDLVVLALLFSSNGAASTTILVADKGQAHLFWPKLCSDASSFCAKTKAANVLSMFASVAYLALIMLTVLSLHRRT